MIDFAIMGKWETVATILFGSLFIAAVGWCIIEAKFKPGTESRIPWLVGTVVLLALAAYFWTTRETVHNVGSGSVVVVNKWTGKAWLIKGEQWREVTGRSGKWRWWDGDETIGTGNPALFQPVAK